MLRRLFVLLTLLGLTAWTAGAALGQGIAIGAKGGLNIADLTIEDPTDVDVDLNTRTAFAGGLFLQFRIGDILAIQPEGLYSSKGAREQEEGVELKIKLDYFEVPLLVMARVPTTGNIRPLVYAGPVVSFESRCKVEGEEDGIELSFDCDAVPEDPVKTKSTDFGLAFGAGVEVDLERWMLQVDGRYNLGLTNLNDTPGAEEVSVKNRTWSFFAGLGFHIR